MGRPARSLERARPNPDTEGTSLSPESTAILADFVNAIRATPTRDLRTTFEQVVARRAGVMRVRLRPAMPAAAESTAAAAVGAAAADAATPAPADAAAPTDADAAMTTAAAAAAAAAKARTAPSRGATPPTGRVTAPVDRVTVTWRGTTFVLDAEPHVRDRAYVTHVLRSAAAVAAMVLCAQGVEPQTSEQSLVQPSGDHASERLVGSSPALERLRMEIAQSARNTFTVLIEGESGVGKELVARQIHACSTRWRGPFIPVNCAAVVESLFESELFGIDDGIATGVRARRGKFEQAHGGTLFLDEIAELPLPAQAKLLRSVQDFVIERVGSQTTRRVDVRLIVATNRSLGALVDEGQFRRDLYFRLRSIEIRVAPLRDRREDIVEIAESYLRRCDPVRPPRLSRSAASILCLHHWPGNVRELERTLERALSRSGGQREILLDHLTPDIGQPYRDLLLPPIGQPDESLDSMKSRYAQLKFDQYRGNKRRTCAALDISYHTLIALLKRNGNGNGHRPGAASAPEPGGVP